MSETLTPLNPDIHKGQATLRDHELEALDDLKAWKYNDGWARPMDIGGRDCSHHSRTLSKLVRLGLAKDRRRCVSIVGALGSSRAGKEYKFVKMPIPSGMKNSNGIATA